jgi:hypothetical protein
VFRQHLAQGFDHLLLQAGAAGEACAFFKRLDLWRGHCIHGGFIFSGALEWVGVGSLELYVHLEGLGLKNLALWCEIQGIWSQSTIKPAPV